MITGETIPTIHLNGTSKETLLEDLKNAHLKIREAIKAVVQTAPHLRDYYVKANAQDAYQRARRQWEYRVSWLESIRSDLEAIADGIESQGRKK